VRRVGATRELAQRYGVDDVLIASIVLCVSEGRD